MIFLLALQFLTAIVNFLLGWFLFFKNPRSATNQAFALFAVGVSGWNLTIFLTLIQAGSATLLWGRLAFSFAALMATGLLWFVHEFPEPSKHTRTWKGIAWVMSIIFFTIPASPYMITSVWIVDGHIAGNLVPSWYWTWDIFYLVTLTYAMIRTWYKTTQAKGLMRNQLRNVSLGITAFLVPYLAFMRKFQ